MLKRVMTIAAALALMPFVSHAATPKEDPSKLTADQAREENAYAIGVQAYLWGFPLAEYTRTEPRSVEVGGVCQPVQSIRSTSVSFHSFSKNALVGPYSRTMSSNSRAGSVGTQFDSLPAGAFGPK